MKIARIMSETAGAAPRYAIIEEEQATLLEASPLDRIEPTDETLNVAEIQAYLPPVDPPNIIAIGLNYRGHAAESGMELPERPVVFLKATSALTGHGSPIVLPEVAAHEVDYEAELAVVIGKEARKVAPENAMDHVLGCTCANDVSARDCQMRLDVQWARAKSFDTFAPVGPWIETDLDPGSLRMRSILNGEVMQDSSTSDLIFPVEELISFISHSMTLLPGTIIMTGTPEGIGHARDPQVFLKPGDTIGIEIEGIGSLVNPVEGP